MERTVQDTYNSITTLLDHKQRYATAIEARSARRQSDATAAAGRTLMVFTVVTVIFLPLSFLAAFFAISIKELPHNAENEQQFSLSFVLRYVVGVGLGTALKFVLVAIYLPGFLGWLKVSRTSAEIPMAGRDRVKFHGDAQNIDTPKHASAISSWTHLKLRSRIKRSMADEERIVAAGLD